MSKHPIAVLLVEDNPADARLLESHFEAAAREYHLYTVRSGEEALSFLYHGVEFSDAPRPDVVLLDLNLPEMTGFEVLAAIRQHEHLKGIPVIVLTGSTDAEDVKRAYALEASCYLTKPPEAEGYAALIENIDEFLRQKTSVLD